MTNFRYPSLEMIESLFAGTSALEKVSIEGVDDLEKTYSKGAFFLSSFTSDFDKDFFETGSDKKYDFAENLPLKNNCSMGGRALISSSSLRRRDQRRANKKSKYPSSIFQTGHILGHQLIYNIPDYNFNASNQANIFPQSRWSNKTVWERNSDEGNTFSLIENLMATALNSKKNKDGKLKLYYQVDLLYSNAEQVPRAMLQQILSNNQDLFSNLIVLIPNIDLDTNINYSSWNHEDNISVK
ncbi:hypothetical protein [Streptococcus suis]|uniref:hypothetical protein n=1 Tax=Streptococcus suis TaxID=1307 RepID=UPI002E12F5C1|nr:hypothetical protein U0697_01925 [Streptococcus suis]